MTTVDLEQQRLLIGGEWVEASGGGTFERTDPLTGEPVTLAAAAGRDDARRAVEAAAEAFPAWSATAAGERRALLNAAADKLMEAAPDIAGVMTEEVGGTFGWGMFNCDLASKMLREAAAQAYSVVGEVIPSDVPGSLALGVRQPAGVVVGMAPWNAPVILGTRAVATPLAYGNTVVLNAVVTEIPLKLEPVTEDSFEYIAAGDRTREEIVARIVQLFGSEPRRAIVD